MVSEDFADLTESTVTASPLSLKSLTRLDLTDLSDGVALIVFPVCFQLPVKPPGAATNVPFDLKVNLPARGRDTR